MASSLLSVNIFDIYFLGVIRAICCITTFLSIEYTFFTVNKLLLFGDLDNMENLSLGFSILETNMYGNTFTYGVQYFGLKKYHLGN